MYKKGMGWSTIVIIIILIVSFAILLGWYISQGTSIIGMKEGLTCKLSFLQASDLSKLKCDSINIGIESDNTEDAKKEILGLFDKMSGDFLLDKKFTRNGGFIFDNTFCKTRYIINFKNDLEIRDFKSYLKNNAPPNLKNRIISAPDIVSSSRIYEFVLVVVSQSYFDTWYGKGISGLIWAIAWKGVESDYIGFALVDASEIDTLKCSNPV